LRGVIWITGLSGVGKTTIARHVCDQRRKLGEPAILLDGDELRAIIPTAVGHTPSDRRRVARFYSDLAGTLAGQGHLVVCSTISLFHDIQAHNRKTIDGYFEVLVHAATADLIGRDQRQVYKSRRHVVGRDIAAELPTAPDLVVDNSDGTDSEHTAATILSTYLLRSETS
jgi:adenylylsulfate kinase-like enzyme